MSAHRYEPKSGLGRFVNAFEETSLAALLGVMTLVTFVNVVLRYVFNSSLIWGLEVVLILFAWLVLFGITYGFKVTSHLGVDAIINLLPHRGKRVLAILSALVCLAYAALLLKGAWDYWAPFADLDKTTGRWFPTGFDEKTRNQAFYITEQIPMLDWLRFMEDWLNEGERYDKFPRVIPYAIIPFSAALMLFRIGQVTLRIIRGEQNSLIVSHEAEDAVEEAAATVGKA